MRILMVTYHFPPDGAIGAVRPYEFAWLLPQHGVDVWVLTVLPEYAERLDPSAVPEGIPMERIIRTSVLPSRRDRYLQITQGLRRWIRGRTGKAISTQGSSSGASHSPRRTALLWRCFTDWLSYPDWYAGWRHPALQAADSLMREVQFSAVLSTAPPRTPALIGLAIAQRYGLPYILDLQDPWLPSGAEWTGGRLCPLFRRLHERVFVDCMRQAGIIVANTSVLAENLQQKYPQCRGKVHVIPNGVPRHLPVDIAPAVPSFRFVVGHFGTVYGARTARAFLEGLGLWLKSGKTKERTQDIEVWFYGEAVEDIEGQARELGLEAVVHVHPPIARVQAIQLMRQSTVLLLLAQKQPLQIPAKTYEYLAMGKPIIAMTEHDGATGRLLRDAPSCYITETADEVVQALERLWHNYIRGEALFADRTQFVEPLRYPNLAEQLASLVKDVVQRG